MKPLDSGRSYTTIDSQAKRMESAATSANWLVTRQNRPEVLQWIAAASDRYRRAKTLLAVQALFVVLVPVLLAAVKLVEPRVGSWAALYGVLATLLDLILLDRQLKTYQRQGALSQEAFDCEVLHLEWNDDRIGEEPTVADKVEWSRGYLTRIPDASHHRNWYPIVSGEIPVESGRLICLLSSCRWDIKLRKRYAAALFGTAVVLALMLMVFSIIADARVETLLLTAAAVLPAVVWPLRGWKTQGEVLEAVESQRKRIERLWAHILNETPSASSLTIRARAIQDDIFQRRKSSQPIFDWVYKHFRPSDETEMNQVAEEMVEIHLIKSKR
jgi:hypothetical protein